MEAGSTEGCGDLHAPQREERNDIKIPANLPRQAVLHQERI